MIRHKQRNSGQSLRPDKATQNFTVVPFETQFESETVLSLNRTEGRFRPAKMRWLAACLGKKGMKVAAKENRKALDYFTSTIIPSQALQAVAVLTIKHAVLLIGFGVGVMALVRLILAD